MEGVDKAEDPGRGVSQSNMRLSSHNQLARTVTGVDSALPLVEDRETERQSHWGSRFVFKKRSPVRLSWTVLITLLLVYTGTIFLYRLCFIDFRITLDGSDTSTAANPGWAAFDLIVTIIFWVDLLVNFFFSYDREDGSEVDDLSLVAKHYLSTHFAINAIACIPEDLIGFVIEGSASNQINQGVRALRLQRMSRLARLMRLTRMAKMGQQKNSRWFKFLQKQKGIRVINLVFGLGWIVHVIACGWYLCAALHDVPEDSWVFRRGVDAEGKTLADSEAFDQWMHAMYFVLTVFTTVGFGDMSAVTLGEIVYVCVTMGIGAVVHSIIISEVINVVMSNDKTNEFLKKQGELIDAFCSHTELRGKSSKRLQFWVQQSAKHWVSHKYDRDEMKEIITGRSMPRELLGQLPLDLFDGKLVENRLLTVCDGLCNTPPRLPMLLALSLQKAFFKAGETIYQVQDFPFNVFLVMDGTFSLVAKPGKGGGATVNFEQPGLKAPRHTKSTKQQQNKAKHHVVQLQTLTEAARMTKRGIQGALRSPKTDHEDEEEFEQQDPVKEMFPYILFGPGSYFGDVEVIQSRPRRATARCESDMGCLLALGKQDFIELAHQFPNFHVKWEERAFAHDRFRIMRLAGLKTGRTYRHLAAHTVQSYFRKWRAGQYEFQDSAYRTTAMFMSAGQAASKAQMYDQQVRMHSEIRELTRTVSVIAKQVDTIMRKVGVEDQAERVDSIRQSVGENRLVL